MADPWMKFYPRDWRGDQALRAVSIAARGLWMECLCIMHEANPRGHLLLNGVPVGGNALARMAGVSVDEVQFLLDELQQAGVLSVTRKGVIFSRRMTKDHARAQKGKAAAKKRWKSPSCDAPQASDTKQKSDAPNGFPNGIPTTQKPETRSQSKKEEPKGSSKKGTRLSQDWALPRDWGEWAIGEGWPEQTVRGEAEKFRDYWISKPGKDGVKLNWAATWRNWMRNSSAPRLQSINGGNHGKPSDSPQRVQRIITAAARGSSGQDWG